MPDLASWLARHNLLKYADTFTAQEIELSDLPELDETDLKNMGLPLGPRRRFIKAVREDLDLTGGQTKAPAASKTGPDGTVIAERRQLTVMFLDLVGSTALSQHLDPEDLVEVLRLFRDTCTAAVGKFDGHVASFLGDGLMVFFGYPRAHEDDAERAVRAGLQVINDVPKIRTHAKLQVRVGIATGLVVVGDHRGGGRMQDGSAMGEAINLAARLQSMADPGTVIVAPSTRTLAGRAFDFEERGAFKLKGFKQEVRAWQVTAERASASRFMASEGALRSPLTGRTREYSTLLSKWELARQGQGQVVLVSGEAGIGKSRLVEELRHGMTDTTYRRFRYQCSPYHDASALYPVARQLERVANLQPDDSDETKLEKLLALDGESRVQTLKLIAALLNVPFPSRFGALDLTPQQLLEQTLEHLMTWLERETRQSPVLLLFEDAHWVDPTTKILLDRVIARAKDLPILVVITFRPGFKPEWELRSNLTRMPLSQLDFEHVKVIAQGMAGGKDLPDALHELIAARTSGVPLYVEEVAKDLLESDLVVEEQTAFVLNGALPALSVPSTLQDALMARLDRLDSAKEIAQIGAVFGQRFSYPMLASVLDHSEKSLRRNLDRLMEANVISLTQEDPFEAFSFRHALIRDTAYNNLLISERQTLHARAADALRSAPAQAVETGPEILAHHYTVAKRHEEASLQWFLAGQHAVQRSANTEAVTLLSKAITQLKHLGQSPERDLKEIEIQVLRAGVLRSTAGIAADETGKVYARIRDLCRRAGTTEHLFPVLNGLYAFHLVRAEYDDARAVAQELLDLSDQTGETHHIMVAHRAMGAVLLHIGVLPQAKQHLETSLALYQPEEHGKLAYVYGTDHAAITSSFLGVATWLLGAPTQALKLQEAAVKAAEALDHAHSTAQSLTYLCMIHMLHRDTAKTRETGAVLARLSAKHNFSFMTLTADLWRSWADAFDAPGEETIRLLRRAAEAYWSAGAGNYRPFFLTLIAEVMLAAGDEDGARQMLTEAEAFQQVTNERWAQAETERVSARLASSQQAAAVGFASALRTAKDQNARMFQLRAETDYLAWARSSGRGDMDVSSLKDLIATLEEAEGSADLQRAQHLLMQMDSA